MSTSREELAAWFDEGIRQGATHMVVKCDTFDYEDYPVYVMPGQDPRVEADSSKQPGMTRVMEVYKLDPAMREEQLRSWRVFNY